MPGGRKVPVGDPYTPPLGLIDPLLTSILVLGCMHLLLRLPSLRLVLVSPAVLALLSSHITARPFYNDGHVVLALMRSGPTLPVTGKQNRLLSFYTISVLCNSSPLSAEILPLVIFAPCPAPSLSGSATFPSLPRGQQIRPLCHHG